jgi:hypothetical protein
MTVTKIQNTRRDFLKTSSTITAGMVLSGILPHSPILPIQANDKITDDEPMRTFTLDFAWAKPGQFADADPKEHIKWYADLGCNTLTIVSMGLSGYAWYKNGVVPEQPGLKCDFMTEMVKLGHQKKMKVFGYVCPGINLRWQKEHPDLCYQKGKEQLIPYTQTYLNDLCTYIEDAIKKTDMDGLMVDWFHNPGGGKNPLPPLQWLPCEQEMYQELMDEPFPGKEKMTPEIELVYRRKAIERAWQRMKTTAKRVKPNCIIWLSSYEINSEEYKETSLLKEIDMLQSEFGDPQGIQKIRNLLSPETKLVMCTANIKGKEQLLKIISGAEEQKFGINDFAQPHVNSLRYPISFYLSKPIDDFKDKDSGDLHIAILARVFNRLPLNYIAVDEKPEAK